jgi:hypothetical protein
MMFKLSESGQVASIKLPQSLDQIDQGPNGEIAITAFDTGNPPKPKPNGILFMQDFSATPKWIPFDSTTINGETFLPNFPKGIAFASGKIFVATSNIEFGKDLTPKKYYPGSIFVISNNKTIDEAIYTGGKNATSMGAWTQGGLAHIAVVNTGYLNYGGATKGEMSSVTIIDAKTLDVKTTTPLPFGGAGVAGEVAIAGGVMAIPSADNSRRIAIVNLQTQPITIQTVTIPEAQSTGAHFVSFAKIYGHHLFAGNFNTGTTSTWDLNTTPPALVGSPIKFESTSIGDAACIGGTPEKPCILLVTLGDKIMRVE